MDERERTLVGWARRVARDPITVTQDDVDQLRDVGCHDQEIHAVTTFVALRLAFSTVNDALGARPDRQLVEKATAAVRSAVGYGRPVALDLSTS